MQTNAAAYGVFGAVSYVVYTVLSMLDGWIYWASLERTANFLDFLFGNTPTHNSRLNTLPIVKNFSKHALMVFVLGALHPYTRR